MASRVLGKTTVEPPRGRGRKYFIAKEHSKEIKDLLDGKQQSIERDIRAVHAQKKGQR